MSSLLLSGLKSVRTAFWVPPPLPLGVYEVTVGGTGGAGSVNVVVPSGCVAERSLLWVHVSMDSAGLNSFDITGPVGWVRRGERVQTRGAGAVFSTIVTQAMIDAGVQTFSISSSSQPWVWQCARIEGHDIDDPIDQSTTRNFESNSTFMSPNPLTASLAGSMHMYSVTGGWGGANFAQPSLFTEIWDRNTGGSSSSHVSGAAGYRIIDTPASIQPAPTCTLSIHRSMLHQTTINPFPA